MMCEIIRRINLENINLDDEKFLNKFEKNSKKILKHLTKIPIIKSELKITFLEREKKYYLVQCTYYPIN